MRVLVFLQNVDVVDDDDDVCGASWPSANGKEDVFCSDDVFLYQLTDLFRIVQKELE
jgi:hypothetical protein